MKQKSIERILYSTVGVAAMALIAIAFNIITSAAEARSGRVAVRSLAPPFNSCLVWLSASDIEPPV